MELFHTRAEGAFFSGTLKYSSISFGVALWITAFDINYALMDVEVGS